MSVTRETVQNILKSITDPASGADLMSSGVVRALNVDGGNIRFVLEIDAAKSAAYDTVKAEAEKQLGALDEVGTISIVMTAHQAKQPPDLKAPGPRTQAGPEPVPGIKRIIAIASGKGGVGKSTVSANLACALAAQGCKVGLLDADVYGPSQPRMLGVSGRPSSPDGKTILPMRNHGVTMMSIGLMTNEDQAVVWRGPMLMGALQQMLTQVQWGALDVLLVDLPPGTGDVQMTLAQKTIVDGAVIVSTPQDVALLDARKGVDMFNQLKVPILGMIENMSTHICSNCGHEEHIFGHGGVAAEAAKLGVPLLAEIPLSLDIRLAADGGAPIVVTAPDSAQAAAFHEVASKLREKLGV
ncbi:iron-sulfur cluster carrier protein ApbC [Marimonas sp. MJW-29]|uniref:Iron-sulfur cluster carrier protein n=1 Tax=Sulfitobacter sediminis TaxID=3234186 RepID=A0ABV3RM98_9RHOB